MEAFRELIILLEYHNIHFIKEKHAFCIVNTNETYILAPDQIPILIDRTIEQCKNLIKSLGQKKKNNMLTRAADRADNSRFRVLGEGKCL